jgi:hypothetical protein
MKGMSPPPQMPKLNLDLSKATDVKCENPKCGNYTFQEVVLLKEFSAIASPTGKAGIVPVPVFACNACGFVNDRFLPPFMRTKDETVNTEPAQPSKIQLV